MNEMRGWMHDMLVIREWRMDARVHRFGRFHGYVNRLMTRKAGWAEQPLDRTIAGQLGVRLN